MQPKNMCQRFDIYYFSHFLDANGKQLVFAVKKGTDSTALWKGTVRVACVKVLEYDFVLICSCSNFANESGLVLIARMGQLQIGQVKRAEPWIS